MVSYQFCSFYDAALLFWPLESRRQMRSFRRRQEGRSRQITARCRPRSSCCFANEGSAFAFANRPYIHCQDPRRAAPSKLHEMPFWTRIVIISMPCLRFRSHSTFLSFLLALAPRYSTCPGFQAHSCSY